MKHAHARSHRFGDWYCSTKVLRWKNFLMLAHGEVRRVMEEVEIGAFGAETQMMRVFWQAICVRMEEPLEKVGTWLRTFEP